MVATGSGGEGVVPCVCSWAWLSIDYNVYTAHGGWLAAMAAAAVVVVASVAAAAAVVAVARTGFAHGTQMHTVESHIRIRLHRRTHTYITVTRGWRAGEHTRCRWAHARARVSSNCAHGPAQIDTLDILMYTYASMCVCMCAKVCK